MRPPKPFHIFQFPAGVRDSGVPGGETDGGEVDGGRGETERLGGGGGSRRIETDVAGAAWLNSRRSPSHAVT